MDSRTSARREAEHAEARAVEYRRRAIAEQQRADNFRVADRTETEVAARLDAMAPWGWTLLRDRRWPGTSRANIDMIAVGPGGVLVIDVKCWAEPDIVDGRLYRGQADASDELDKLAHVAGLVTDATAEIGLAPLEVVPVMVFVGQLGTDTNLGRIKVLDDRGLVSWALRRGDRLTEDQLERLVKLLDDRFPEYDTEEDRLVSAAILEPVVPLSKHREPEPDSLFDTDALVDALLEREREKPIEDWMTFLHPEQVRLVRRVGPGPSRIRGSAGTGKTVVALHRAAYLAESLPGPVLVTSFIKTLPPVLASLYRRLSPATAERVEFVNLHQWASRLIRARGHRVLTNPYAMDNAYSRAWSAHGKGTSLADLGVPWGYWREEIDHVIKGRGITDFDDYARLKRIGRRTALQAGHREIVWAIYVEYQQQLRLAQVLDFNDLISLALAEVRERPLDVPYSAVIADEIQDLSCQAVRLLAQISDEGRGLLVVGDGQQQLYPGGYTLAEAGISVVGRSTVLHTNYRNAAEILTAAATVVADDEYQDLEDGPEVGRRDTSVVRTGGQVWQIEAATNDELRRSAVEHVVALVKDGNSPAGVALICSTNREANAYLELLSQAGIKGMKLENYDGTPTPAVKVGTVHRAKGLEFKHVLRPFDVVRDDRNSSPEARQELAEQAHRELFVAMTRARDTLWIGRVA